MVVSETNGDTSNLTIKKIAQQMGY